MNRLRWLITLPLAIVLVVFAVNNRNTVDINLWPLGLTINLPLFIYVFLGAGIGVLMGVLFTWFSGGATRKLARERRSQIRELEHKVETMQARFDAEEREQPARPPALPE